VTATIIEGVLPSEYAEMGKRRANPCFVIQEGLIREDKFCSTCAETLRAISGLLVVKLLFRTAAIRASHGGWLVVSEVRESDGTFSQGWNEPKASETPGREDSYCSRNT
jgi:hypothetical protein